jgi:hypothetical protein
MTNIESIFNDTFSPWAIRLSPEAVKKRERGTLTRAGWAIWYLFGADEAGEYLDYYASHRMTNDRHERIRADGRCETLPAIQDFRPRSDDPEEDARLEAAYFAGNQAVVRMLEEKGWANAGLG